MAMLNNQMVGAPLPLLERSMAPISVANNSPSFSVFFR